MARGRRRFGRIRRLPSGRWQARYTTPDGREHTGPQTFESKADADRYLADVERAIGRGTWIDPALGRCTVKEYAAKWLITRPKPLRPRTVELYEGLLRLHINPVLGGVEIAKLSPSTVRQWHSAMLHAGQPGAVTVAKCYRLLRAILATAVEDEVLVRNPCVIKGAGVENSPERQVATVPQIWAIADKIEPRYRLLVLLAAFTGCRWGELVALTRQRIDLLHCTLTVTEQFVETQHGLAIGPPKSDAGRRTVTLSQFLRPEIEAHLDAYVAADPTALVFCGPQGAPLRRRNFNRVWHAARKKAKVPPLRLHDLRHTHNTLAAASGASLRELMARMGHSSTRAAILYQHATKDRDAAIAAALGQYAVPATAGAEDPSLTAVPRAIGHAAGT